MEIRGENVTHKYRLMRWWSLVHQVLRTGPSESLVAIDSLSAMEIYDSQGQKKTNAMWIFACHSSPPTRHECHASPSRKPRAEQTHGINIFKIFQCVLYINKKINIYIVCGVDDFILVLTKPGLENNYLLLLIFNIIVLFSNVLKTILRIILHINQLK